MLRKYLALLVSAGLPLLLVGGVLGWFSSATRVAQASPDGSGVVISQVFGAGGNSGATFKADYVELFNPAASAADISGWSLQYGSQTGNFGSSSSNIVVFPAGTVIQPGRYFLTQLGPVGANGVFPTAAADLITTNINLSGASGKLALANGTAGGLTLGCGAVATPCTLPDSRVADLVAYGNVTTTMETTAAGYPTPLTNTQGVLRKVGGCQDTDNNFNDFTVVVSPTLSFRNSSYPASVCGLHIAKSAPTTVGGSEVYIYTVVVSNTGVAAATNTVITDLIPAEVSLVPGSISDGGELLAGNVVSWSVTSLAQGESATRTFAVTAPATSGTSIVNQDYQAYAENLPAPVVGAPVTTLVGAPNLAVTKTGPEAAVEVGDPVTFTLTYRNSGDAAAAATLVDQLPAGLAYSEDSLGTGNLAGNLITWSLGTVAPGAEASLVLTTTALYGGTYTNTATISGTPADSDLTDNSALAAVSITGPALYVTKSGPASLPAGEVVAYTIFYGNRGTAAVNAILTDTLPAGVTVADIAGDTSGLTVGTDTGSTRDWTTSLNPGDAFYFTLSITVPNVLLPGTRLTNTITINPMTGVDDPVDNTATASGLTTGVTPIGTARAAGAGWIGTIRGNVTVPTRIFRNNAFAIQDGTGGMYIYGPTSALTLGDMVQVTGTIKNYNGLLEIDPVASWVKLGAGAVPTPLVISTSAVSTMQGWLVQVTGTVTWTTAPRTGINSTVFINDGSGAVAVYVYGMTGIDMSGITSPTQMTITGFAGAFNVAQLQPRYQSDMVDLTVPGVNSTTPAADATGVSLYSSISAVFNKAMNPATVTTETFTLEGPAGAVAGSVGYISASRTAVFTPTVFLDPQTLYTATLTTDVQDPWGAPLPAPYTWSFTTGDTDVVAPFIVSHVPVTDAINVPLNTTVIITFSEDLNASTVVLGNFTLTGPSGAMSWNNLAYNAAAFKVTLTAPTLVNSARYTVTVGAGLTDWAGNPVAPISWSFTAVPEAQLYPYHGDLHNHTSYSDGSGTPAEALAAGKAAGFDFMAITDHSYALDDTEWPSILTAVNAATDSTFVALRGFEYTQGAEGHINVYNTIRHACRSNTGFGFCDYTPNLEAGATVLGFYQWQAITGTQALDGAGTVLQFNHPGWINFNDWVYHPEISATARLEEVGNGNGASYVFSEDEYIRSLDYGWKLGATNNADTHTTAWGVNTDDRTGVWAAGLTKADLLDALRARRTFATEDKNANLYLKGNGSWMGSEIANTGSLALEIYGADPDNEIPTLVQLITFGGQVVTSTQPAASTFTWRPTIAVSAGAHYYYVKLTQADGDRIVGSPIWVTAAVNVSLTDLAIEPSIATIYNPTLITARVTNRMTTAQTLTVTFQVNGTPQTAVTTTVPGCTVGPCTDGYAVASWQPEATGAATISAVITGVPAGDNLEDNQRSARVDVTSQKIPLVLIDSGHNNIAAKLSDVRLFMNDLTAHGYNVLLNLDDITASDLNTNTVKLLILNAYGPDSLKPAELVAIGNFVNAGGSLWLNGLADYTGKVYWAADVSIRMNEILTAVETTTAYTIPVRFNSDEVEDGNNNNGYTWGVTWHIFPGAATTGVGMNVENIQSWSLNSFVDRDGLDLTESDLIGNGFIAALGDEDPGANNRTHNTDTDPTVRAYIYTAGHSVPGAVGYDIPGPAGRIFFYGDANDPYNIFSYTAGDGRQNELFNLETAMWLLGTPISKGTIAQARAEAVAGVPDNLNKLVWVEGRVTAGFGEFFNTLYVQDATGGIAVHAPAGDISATQLARNTLVRVLGTISTYQGDTEVQFFEAEQVQVITPTDGLQPAPLALTTYNASRRSNLGWLAQITGAVTYVGPDYVIVNDTTGPVRVFLDGYNGTWTGIRLGDFISVRGLVSQDNDGTRLRARNHGMHLALPDDVTQLTVSRWYLVLIRR